MAKNTDTSIPILQPYNPLDKRHLGEQVAEALLAQDIQPLPPNKFKGAGVYAIYYIGKFDAYNALFEVNKNNQYSCPIYVGKAVPSGARKGGQGDNVDPGLALYNRLSDHAKSITEAKNLNLSDFRCRYLAVDDIWIPLAESMIIERFKPVWNCLLEGFGNHDPGKGRTNGKMSPWDRFHPGRSWAKNLQPFPKSETELKNEVVKYLNDALGEE